MRLELKIITIKIVIIRVFLNSLSLKCIYTLILFNVNIFRSKSYFKTVSEYD